MNAIRIDEYVKDYDEIKVSEVPFPQPKDGEVIVKVEAVAINFVDLLYCRGKHQNNHRKLVTPPFTLGLEFSGTVQTSTPTSHFPIGAQVFGTTVGTFTTHISLPPSLLHPLPPSFPFIAASTLPATAPVSYGALILRGDLQRGETVLIHGASGGLGLYAVQIAKAIGATVIGTAGTEEKCQVVKTFRADFCVNHASRAGGERGWEYEVLKLTGGKGVDVVFDSVGLVERSLRCLKPQGRILVVGFAGREGNLESLPANKVLLKQASVIGYRFGETNRTKPAETAQIWKGLNQMIEVGKIKPAVFEKEYVGLESVKIAMRDLSERKVWGKAVVRIGDADQHAQENDRSGGKKELKL